MVGELISIISLLKCMRKLGEKQYRVAITERAIDIRRSGRAVR